MKKTLLLILSLLPLMMWATQYSGKDTVENWTPGRGQNGAMMKDVVVSWNLNDYGGTSVSKGIAIQWKLGEHYVINGKKHAINTINAEAIKALTLNSLLVKMNVFDSKGTPVGSISFEMAGNIPAAGAQMGKMFTQTVAWDKVFTDMTTDATKALFKNGFRLDQVSIHNITWGGTFAIEQALNNTGTGPTPINSGSNLGNNTNSNGTMTNVPPVNAQQQNFDNLVKEGDAAFYQKNYALALQKYRAALQIKPNEPSVVKKVADTELAQRKDNYIDLMQEGDKLAQRRDFNGAMQKFQQARNLFNDYELAQMFPNMPTPTVKMQMIELEIAKMNYAAAMENGDRAFMARDYKAAVTHYRNALSIFPADVPAANKLHDAERQIELAIKFDQTVRELTAKYEDKSKEAASKSQKYLNQAVRSFNEEVEDCNLDYYNYQVAYQDFFDRKKQVAQDEAAFLIYGDLQAKNKANIPLPTILEPACNQFDGKGDVLNASAETYFETAKRKYELGQKMKVNEFSTLSKDLTEDALKINPNLADAWAFMANFTNDNLEKMLNIQKALSIEPNNKIAKQLQSQYLNKFVKDLHDNIRSGQTTYLDKVLQDANLWKEVDFQYNGRTPFQTAVENDQESILFSLYSRNFPESSKAQDLLFLAAEKDAGKCVRTLLNRGAKCDVQNASGQTPLSLATKRGSNKVVAALTASCGGKLDTGGALLTAVENNQVSVAQTLLKAGAYTETTNSKGENLLMVAIAKKADEMVKTLIDAGANVNAQSTAGETPLMYAASVESYNIISMLLSKGADEKMALTRLNAETTATGAYLAEKVAEYGIDQFKPIYVEVAQGFNPYLAAAKANNGQALMLYAIEKGSYEAAKALIDSEVNFNEPFNGKYILIEAIQRDLVEIVRELLQKGKVSLDIRTSQNETPLHLAARNGKIPMIELLVNNRHSLEAKDGKGNTALMTAIEAEKSEAAGAMINMGFDLNAKNLRGNQAIHTATILKDGYVVELLLAKGVEVNAKGEDLMTPLHFAAKNGDRELAKFLLSKGADKKAKDKFKRTASKVAKQGKFKDLAKILK